MGFLVFPSQLATPTAPPWHFESVIMAPSSRSVKISAAIVLNQLIIGTGWQEGEKKSVDIPFQYPNYYLQKKLWIINVLTLPCIVNKK